MPSQMLVPHMAAVRSLVLAVECGSLTEAGRRVNDLLAIADLAERGAGIAVLPDYVARPAVARRRLVPVLPRVTLTRLPLHVVYPSRRHLARRVQVVVDALVAARARL